MKQSSKIELISPLLVVEREIFIVRQANRPLAHNGIAESIDINVLSRSPKYDWNFTQIYTNVADKIEENWKIITQRPTPRTATK